MRAHIELYNDIITKVWIFYKGLRLDKLEKDKGRKLAISIPGIIALSIFKQKTAIPTKKRVYDIFQPECSYKTMVVNMNRFALLAGWLLVLIIKANQRSQNQHFIKHTDSTDVPVCSNRKAKKHRTMKILANWGKTGKGWFYGLKLHITTDLKRGLLSIKFTSGNVPDCQVFMELNKDLFGVFVADAAYIGEELGKKFYEEGRRILFAMPRKNMRKLITAFQFHLYNTRMLIEIDFRNLKLFYGLVTTLPRSVNGYLANYIYSLLAYLIA